MRFIAYLLLALTAVAVLPGLGERDFWPPDEARYGSIAAELARGDDLAALHLNGRLYGDKPPGFFWVARVAAFFRGEIDETAVRIPSVLGALILVLALGLAVGRTTGAQAGFLAGLLPLATWSFAWQARSAQLDLLFAGLVTWAAFAGFRALEEGRPRLLVRAGFALGLAILVKGPLALLVLPLLLLWRLVGRPSRPEGLRFGGAVYAAFAAMVLPPLGWLGLLVHEAGFDFVRDELLLRNVVERAATGLAHIRPWTFYLERTPPALLPWLLFLPVLLLPEARALLGREGRRLAAFSLLWLLLFLAVQSLFPGKRSIYAFLFHAPLYALIAQAAAAGTSERGGRSARLLAGLVLALVGVVVLAIASLLAGLALSPASFAWTLDRLGEILHRDLGARLVELALPMPGAEAFAGFQQGLRLAALPFVLGAVLIPIALLRRRLELALDRAAFAFALGLMLIAANLLPALDASRSRRALADQLRAVVGEEEMAIYRHLDEGLLYYFGRPIPELRAASSELPDPAPHEELQEAIRRGATAALAAWLRQPENAYVVIRREDREGLGDAVAGRRYRTVHAGRVGSDTDFELLRFGPREEAR